MKKDKKQSWFQKVSDVAKYKKMYNTLDNKYATVKEKYIESLEKRLEVYDENRMLRDKLKEERAKFRKYKRDNANKKMEVKE